MCDKIDPITSSDSNQCTQSSPPYDTIAELDKRPCPIRNYDSLESVLRATRSVSFYSVPRGHEYQRGLEECCFRILWDYCSLNQCCYCRVRVLTIVDSSTPIEVNIIPKWSNSGRRDYITKVIATWSWQRVRFSKCQYTVCVHLQYLRYSMTTLHS